MNPEIAEASYSDAVNAVYDLGIWAAGYEARSSWLVQSDFKPKQVAHWWKVEFEEHRDAHSGPESRNVQCGRLVGGGPGRQNRDGHWLPQWKALLDEAFARKKAPIDVFVDYSSMPRAVYGSLLIECLRAQQARVGSLTFAYVPGEHGKDIDGSRGIEGLRPLIGTEGASRYDRTAFVVGLGYDGILAQTVLELFQVAHFSCFYADPGVKENSVERVLTANDSTLSRAELVSTAAAWKVREVVDEIGRLCDWYADTRDVLLVPLGPKPHVLASIIVASMRPEIGFRFPETTRVRPVEVTVEEGTVPYFTTIRPR